jgi:hypothetical protein
MGSLVIILNNNEPMAKRSFSERRADCSLYQTVDAQHAPLLLTSKTRMSTEDFKNLCGAKFRVD